jgi:hypothetical protein
MVRKLMREGFTKNEIARRMGLKIGSLRIKKRIQAATEQRLKEFYNYYTKEAA